MKLSSYQRKRDFAKMPEPSGKVGRAVGKGSPRFVVQRHRASRLHYDLRLEIGGVLVSWAVPKGPTLDPAVRRAAFHVEDHPLSYFDFEGVIPAGQYGGGDVIVWDVGTWEPVEPDPARAVAEGELHFDVQGEKLHGRFVLVRTKTAASGKEDWLLLHKRDPFAVEGWEPEDYPHSVLSGRTNEEVKEGRASESELTALDSLGASGKWRVHGREFRLSNLDRVVVPGRPPVTKRDLLRYTARIAATLVPYLADRAVKMRVPARAPSWVRRTSDGYLLVEEPAALVWAASSGAVQWQAWTSQTGEPELPTHAVIELTGMKWPDLLVLARLYRTAFEHLRLTARAMISGDKDIHLWVPIKPGPSGKELQAWVGRLSNNIRAAVPELSSWKLPKLSQTTLLPYSPRSLPKAPVAAPISWPELDDPALTADRFTISTMPERLTEHGDLFAAVLQHTQRLPKLE